MAKYYTPGKVASMLGVTPRTVANWYNEGLIKGHVLPGPKGHRRLLGTSIVEFLVKHFIEVPEELREEMKKQNIEVPHRAEVIKTFEETNKAVIG